MRLIGLDVETANPSSCSICAAGVVCLDNGITADKREWLIQPHQSVDWMRSAFTKIHGIGYYDLRQSRTASTNNQKFGREIGYCPHQHHHNDM